jgi:hypothetical protein
MKGNWSPLDQCDAAVQYKLLQWSGTCSYCRMYSCLNLVHRGFPMSRSLKLAFGLATAPFSILQF